MPPFVTVLYQDKSKNTNPPSIVTDDPATIEDFARRYNPDGGGIYTSINPLRRADTVRVAATYRQVENLEAIERIAFDFDSKDYECSSAELLAALQNVVLPFTHIHNSGGGYHCRYELRERVVREEDPEGHAEAVALQKELVRLLCADPLVCNPHSLLRLPGSLNHKYGEPLRVERVGGSGEPVDISELRKLRDILRDYHEPFLKKQEKDMSPGEPQPYKTADEVLDDMEPGVIHSAHLSSTSKMLLESVCVDEVVLHVLSVTKESAWQPDWNEGLEERTIRGMCYDFITKHPELSHLLPDDLRRKFDDAKARGCSKIRIRYMPHRGRWEVAAWGGPKTENVVEFPSGAPKQEGPARRIDARPFEEFDEAALTPRQWAYGRHYQLGVVTATVGPGGIGKSSITLVELVAMCTARPLLGEQPLERFRVWYHNAEDPRDEIYRRLAGVLRHFEIPQEELAGWMYITSGLEMPIQVGRSHGGSFVADKTTVEQIMQTITERQINVASFDPLIAHHGGSENLAEIMDPVCRQFASIAFAGECAVEIVHHTKKPAYGQEELTVYDSRGSGGIINAVRSMRVLNPMSKSEAESLNLDRVRTPPFLPH